MKRFLSMYRVEQKIFFRSPDVILFNLAMPLVVFVVITMITGDKNAADSGLTYLQSAYVSLSTVGICCSAFMSIPITIVECRSQGILRRMYCSPCSPARLLACDTICSGVMAVISTLILTAAAVVVFGYRMRGNVFAYLAVWLLTMTSMFSIGLMVASLCRTTKSMNVATSLLYFPMLLFSGATIPAEVFPAGLRAVSGWMPLGVGIGLLKSVSMGCYDKMAMPVMTLIAIAVICGAVAVKTFRWE
ncbi:ABC transporter permease [Oscillibacter valericigenes]|uniref:ABC transporter permease n=1 Tax=Oscillibacter valericigenes TaxID=351091 RepID=UPI001F1696EF|nr:ABC transporter permease [Oscillibacter valericigenes]MCF2616014.1 ABC transporter permease [Oscillibacter valericigenes]